VLVAIAAFIPTLGKPMPRPDQIPALLRESSNLEISVVRSGWVASK
jgi:hypothetical protein